MECPGIMGAGIGRRVGGDKDSLRIVILQYQNIYRLKHIIAVGYFIGDQPSRAGGRGAVLYLLIFQGLEADDISIDVDVIKECDGIAIPLIFIKCNPYLLDIYVPINQL